MNHSAFVPLCGLLLSCAASVAQEPKVAPPATPPAPAPATLEVVPALSELTLACRSAELAHDNALDDDCDGSIDHLPRASGLTVAWAHPGDAELAVKLVDADQQALPASESASPSSCLSDHSVATGHARYDALPAGKRTLVLSQVRACGEAKPLTVALSVSTQGSTKAYLVKLEPGQELALGTLTVP